MKLRLFNLEKCSKDNYCCYVIANGVRFPNGNVAMAYVRHIDGVFVYSSILALNAVHCSEGSNVRVTMLDEPDGD